MGAITNSVVIAALVTASVAVAKPSQKPTEKSAEKSPAVEPAVENEALDALRSMSAFLGQQKNFAVHTDMETDYVLDNGQKVTLASHGNLRVARPSRLEGSITSDRKEREFFDDGKTFTINSPKLAMYAQVPAPDTIVELADQLQTKYGLELPLVDLFRWSGDEANFDDITEAHVIGPAKLDGAKTTQYAFRQNGVDWQIWIEQGDKPLPRKLSFTTTDDRARPEHTVAITWQLNASTPDSSFTFTPAKDSKQITIAEIGVPPAETIRHAKRSARR